MSVTQDVAAKVRKQVEFYFSDVNIAKDTFLKSKIAETPEGFVPAAVLLTFKRLETMLTDADNKETTLLEACKNSSALVVCDEEKAIRRKDPLPESIQTDAETVYVKPIPASATLEALQEFFSQFGEVQAIWRRSLPGKGAGLKPSVFVVFSEVAVCEKLIASPPKYDDSELIVMKKTDYLATKAPAKPSKAPFATAPVVKTPPMPRDASICISGASKLNNDFKAVKSLWGPELQAGIRYVMIDKDDEHATVIFQDKETAERMIEDAKTKGSTLNGVVATLTRLNGEEDNQAAMAAEKEIQERAAARAAAGGGRGGGRGGRGGRGRGGRGGKRPRDD